MHVYTHKQWTLLPRQTIRRQLNPKATNTDTQYRSLCNQTQHGTHPKWTGSEVGGWGWGERVRGQTGPTCCWSRVRPRTHRIWPRPPPTGSSSIASLSLCSSSLSLLLHGSRNRGNLCVGIVVMSWAEKIQEYIYICNQHVRNNCQLFSSSSGVRGGEGK